MSSSFNEGSTTNPLNYEVMCFMIKIPKDNTNKYDVLCMVIRGCPRKQDKLGRKKNVDTKTSLNTASKNYQWLWKNAVHGTTSCQMCFPIWGRRIPIVGWQAFTGQFNKLPVHKITEKNEQIWTARRVAILRLESVVFCSKCKTKKKNQKNNPMNKKIICCTWLWINTSNVVAILFKLWN